MAGNIQKGEAPTLSWDRLEIRLDKDLDGLVAVINLDTNRCVAEADLMAFVRLLLELRRVATRPPREREQRQGPVMDAHPQHSCSTAVMTGWCQADQESAA